MGLNDLCNNALGSFEMLERLKGFYALNHQHLKTGVSFIDSVTNGGLILGMTVLGGMPNVGKSTLLVQMAVEICKKGTPVVYVNKDMRAEEVMLKAISYISAMPFLSESYSVTDRSKVYAMGKDIADDVRLEVLQFCERLHIIDVDDAQYESKYDDLQNRLNKMYDKKGKIESEIEDVTIRIININQKKVSGDKVYQFLAFFDEAYDKFTDMEKKQFMQSFIDSIEIYPQEQPDGRILRSIKFAFPIYFDDKETREISWDKENHVESVVLMSKVEN